MVDAARRRVLPSEVIRQRCNQYREHRAKTVPRLGRGTRCRWPAAGTSCQRCLCCRSGRDMALRSSDRPDAPVFRPRSTLPPGTTPIAAAVRNRHGLQGGASVLLAFCGIRCRAAPSRTSAALNRVPLEKVSSLAPEAEGKPGLVGKCQKSSAIMMVAAARPELVDLSSSPHRPSTIVATITRGPKDLGDRRTA
jgi:hypothetical protein